MEKLGKIVKFPNKRVRNTYKKKLFSIYSTIEIINVAVGVLLAEFVIYVIKRIF